MAKSINGLNDKVAIVTGAASGIGRAAAIKLAQAGAAVALVDRNTERLDHVRGEIEQLGGHARCFCFDLLYPEELPNLFADIESSFGKTDILVNVAAILDLKESFLTVDAALWDRTYKVNLRSPFILMQLIGRHLISRGCGGRIVNVSSSSAFRASGSPPTYSSTKAALGQLTRVAAAEFGRHDINVNAVVPGLTDTPMVSEIDKSSVSEGPLANLLHRLSTADDVAEIILFLCLTESRQITGQMIHVSAGAVVN